ncbi:hypothetical protein I302_109051 [Kwoniella bestiolae CBS 10118]|uniref:Inactive metallocarboxypeptidase ECM14 n=1 Tax=Kwoniella bestiolae CBS 10118 TaxID=1296100 RepID=A0A1B9FUV6_9TREE|nr:hypothetical protein I302_08195 [Kwoniella bestiolae CBS 10118]OCF22545.1 hypothetical protein I302_08195 [Kwoniella bestiolae CBS 10118]
MRAFAPTLTLLLSLLVVPSLASTTDQVPFDVSSNKLAEDKVGVERYDDEKVWRIDWSGLSHEKRKEVMHVVELLDLDVWHTTQRSIDIRLNSRELEVLYGYIPQEAFQPFIDDLQSLVDLSNDAIDPQIPSSETNLSEDGEDEAGDLLKKKKKKGKNRKSKPKPKPKIPSPRIDPYNLTTIDTPFHDKFHPLNEMYKFGDTLISTFNDTHLNGSGIDIRQVDIGRTWENETIRGWSAKIHTPLDQDPGYPTASLSRSGSGRSRAGREEEGLEGVELEFVVIAGQHGREWVGPSSALYFLHHLLLRATEDPKSDSAILLRSFRFTVVPQINPDGYAYSRDKSRMWRKNRQDVGGKGSCLGIDLNANWGYKWQHSKSTACSEGYGGREAFEAYETKAMSEYLAGAGERGNRVRAFVDLHSYGQLFMFPFAHSCDDFPPDAEMLMEAGLGVAKAMRTKQGEGYEAGQACDLTYRAPGDAIDYTYGVTDVRWSYSAELRDTGTYGFMLPPKLIRPTADEITAGLMYLAKFIYALEVNPP